MGLEDLSLMRELPTMMVLQPCDEIETWQMMKFLIEDSSSLSKPAYLRLTRQNLASVHSENYKWELGKLDVLEKGSRVALLGTGAGTQEVVGAAKLLQAKGLVCTVVNAPSIKPFDSKGVEKLLTDHELIVTVEDHYVTGGLGSAVA